MEATTACIKISQDKSMEFTLRKSRFYLPAAEKQTYRYQYDESRTRRLYIEICRQIPRYKGAVVIYGSKDHHKILLDCIQSQSNLRERFSNSTLSIGNQPMSRFAWMVSLLQSGIYDNLTIFYTS